MVASISNGPKPQRVALSAAFCIMTHFKKAAELFGIQFTYYMLLTLNYRAIGAANYLATFVTDIAVASLVFMSVQRVAKAETLHERLAYICGGATGAIVALWVSTHWLGV